MGVISWTQDRRGEGFEHIVLAHGDRLLGNSEVCILRIPDGDDTRVCGGIRKREGDFCLSLSISADARIVVGSILEEMF